MRRSGISCQLSGADRHSCSMHAGCLASHEWPRCARRVPCSCSTNSNRRRSCLPSLSHDAPTEALGLVIGVPLLGAASVTDSAAVPCIARDSCCLSSLAAGPNDTARGERRGEETRHKGEETVTREVSRRGGSR
jgi:hypothetical protein